VLGGDLGFWGLAWRGKTEENLREKMALGAIFWAVLFDCVFFCYFSFK